MLDSSDRTGSRAVCTKRFESADGLDVFLFASSPSTREDDRSQFLAMAECLREALACEGLAPTAIVSSTCHFSAAPPWVWRDVLADAWCLPDPELLPVTGIIQPPAWPGCFCSILVHAVRLPMGNKVWHGQTTYPVATTILRAGARHLHLLSALPQVGLGENASFEDQAYDLFAQSGHALTARGLSWKDVVRTWIYVRDIHRNYDGLNRARNQFFTEQGLTRLPASTGIEGFLADTRSPVAMDLYAVAENEQVRVEAADPGLMGEASAYGASFARACQITEPGRTDVYVSGTASVGADGEVVSVGDIGGQLDCMFRNVEAVLAHAGMDLHDTLSATVYLKSAEDQAAFVRACAAHGLSAEVPTAIVVAAICRPAWLCEIELLAARVVASG